MIDTEIRFWKQGVTVSFTETQEYVLKTILGLEVTEKGYTAYTDETLKRMMKMESNPFRLIEFKQQEEN